MTLGLVRRAKPFHAFEVGGVLPAEAMTLFGKGRPRSAFDLVLGALERSPDDRQALTAAHLLHVSLQDFRTLVQSNEPATPEQLRSRLLDRVLAECDECGVDVVPNPRFSDASGAASVVDTRRVTGLQCSRCLRTRCADCAEHTAFLGGWSKTCDRCGTETVTRYCRPTGRSARTIAHPGRELLLVHVYRAGPVPPDRAWLELILAEEFPEVDLREVEVRGSAGFRCRFARDARWVVGERLLRHQCITAWRRDDVFADLDAAVGIVGTDRRGVDFAVVSVPTVIAPPVDHEAFARRIGSTLVGSASGLIRAGAYDLGLSAIAAAMEIAPDLDVPPDLDDTELATMDRDQVQWQTAVERAEADDVEAAEPLLAELTSRRPNWSTVLSDHGLVLSRLGRTDAARARFAQALTLDPWSSPALNNVGLLHLGSGAHSIAATYFRAAVASDPTNSGAARNYAIAMAELFG